MERIISLKPQLICNAIEIHGPGFGTPSLSCESCHFFAFKKVSVLVVQKLSKT